LNSKYIIILSHINTVYEPKYINQVNIVYHNRANWCECIRFFTHRFIHKKLTDKLITELVFKGRNYVMVGEWMIEKNNDAEKTLVDKLIEKNVIGPVIKRFEIKK